MLQIFKNFRIRPVTPANLPEVIRTYKGYEISDLYRGQLLLPSGFKIHTQNQLVSIRKEFQFTDYKEAFSFLQFVASTFNRLHYNPVIFNVYNKVIVDLTDPMLKVPTSKEFFLARFLQELSTNPMKAAINTLDALNKAKI